MQCNAMQHLILCCLLSVCCAYKEGVGRLALSGARTHQTVESGGGGSVGLDVNNEWMNEGGENNHILIEHTYEAVSSTQVQFQLNSQLSQEKRGSAR